MAIEAVSIIFIKNMGQPIYFITFKVLFILIVMYRWKKWFIIPTVLITLVLLIILKANINAYISELVGSSFISFNLLWFKKRNLLEKSLLLTILYLISGYLLVVVGTSLCNILFDVDFFVSINQYFVAYIFSLVISMVVMIIIFKQKTILVEPFAYALELQSSKKEGL